jgi:hypothetical protein
MIGVVVGDAEEKNGEGEEGVLPVGYWKDGLPGCRGCP